MSRYSGYGSQLVDNGILFIIALFYLSCVGCRTGSCGGGFGGGYGVGNYDGGFCGCRKHGC